MKTDQIILHPVCIEYSILPSFEKMITFHPFTLDATNQFGI